jgi:hypothetical protein
MVGGNRKQAALQLQPMINENTQDDVGSLTEETVIVDNELQSELLVSEQRLEPPSFTYVCLIEMIYYIFYAIDYRQWLHFVCYGTKFKRFGAISLLIIIVTTSTVLVVSHYTRHDGNKIMVKSQGKMFIQNSVHRFRLF